MKLSELRVKLASFEGPLDLLLYLVRQHEINICEIKISEITEHYLRTLRLMRELNLDVAGEFILMASTLIQIKSRMLLPQEDEEDEENDEIRSEEELRRKLLEHAQFRVVAKKLRSKDLLGRDIFTRPITSEKQKKEIVLQEVSITELTVAFQKMLMATRRPVERVQRESISVASAAENMIGRLQMNQVTEFHSVFAGCTDRSEVVAQFLAILELARLQKIRVLQHIIYGTIYLVLRETVDLVSLQKEFERGDSYAYTASESSA